jgi:hypothetical protein
MDCRFRFPYPERQRESNGCHITSCRGKTAPLSQVRFLTPVPILLDRNTQSTTAVLHSCFRTVTLSVRLVMYVLGLIFLTSGLISEDRVAQSV